MAMTFTFLMIPVSYLHGVLYIAPTIWPEKENASMYYAAVFLMTFLFANTYSNLLLTLTTDTSCSTITSPIVAQHGWLYCPFCRFHAPPRAHHCRSCQMCILRRDHHCFFVGKCVGYHNHRYFMAFLIYLTMSAIVGVVTSFIAITQLTGGFSLTLLPAFFLPVLAYIFQIMPVNFFVMFQTSIALFVTIAAGCLLILQLFLVYRGLTYHEMQKNISMYARSPKENFEDAFGKNWWFCWFLPFILARQHGDGAHYPPVAMPSYNDAGRASAAGADMQQSKKRRTLVMGTWFHSILHAQLGMEYSIEINDESYYITDTSYLLLKCH